MRVTTRDLAGRGLVAAVTSNSYGDGFNNGTTYNEEAHNLWDSSMTTNGMPGKILISVPNKKFSQRLHSQVPFALPARH